MQRCKDWAKGCLCVGYNLRELRVLLFYVIEFNL